MIIEKLENNDHKEALKAVFKEALQCITTYQKDGLYQTVLNKKSYIETSATLLINGGIMHAYQLGLIDTLYGAVEGFERVLNDYIIDDKLTKVSHPTIPLHVFTTWHYKTLPTKSNWSYGLASLIFSSIAYEKLKAH